MTTRRGIIQFKPGVEKVRISVPGVDVDAAGTTQFLLHEAALYSQPYFAGFVACPFAGNTSTGYLEQSVDVTVPDVTADPIVMHWIVDSDGLISFPCQKATGPGNSGGGFAINSFYARTRVISSVLVRVKFVKPDTSRRSPQGAYLILMRKPDLT
ncbi:hypothetical protein [Mesorhizobium atlanticum]|uniref:Uncharacterized protein n=1 Tax=Mesorhizobium atlanticum TaxID=2233532 RepID=A0A330GZU3_9HYPH|nr:hypothetical protein [Mesorhizobium atlanticum]RAZ75845.1 hypothetical protein DPM35_13940 [Mesorhizobium atlanticum]